MPSISAGREAGPPISVVIPSYNCANYLPECLDSVLAQTLAPAEIVVLDDGSQDGTGDLLAARYPQVRHVWQPNQGLSAARNAGIAAARYDLIAFSDADDVWHPERLERQLGAMEAMPHIGIVGCGLADFTSLSEMQWPDAVDIELIHTNMELAFRGEGTAAAVPTWLVRRRVFDEAGPFDTELAVGEDIDMMLRTLAAGIDAVKLKAVLYGRRVRPDSLSSTGIADYPICRYRALAKHRPGRGSRYACSPSPELYWEAMLRWAIQGMLSAVSHDRWEDAREIASELGEVPSSYALPQLRRAQYVARIVTGTHRPWCRRRLSAGLRTAARVTRSVRRWSSRRRRV